MQMSRAMDAIAAALHGLAGGQGVLLHQSARDWRSATFTGARHSLSFAFDGDDAVAGGEAMLDALPSHAFAIPGQTVADIDVIHVQRRASPPRLEVDCSLLLLETP